MVGHTDLTETRYEMDKALAPVMPDSWAGHARIAAYSEADGLSDKAVEFAVTLADRLSEKTGASSEVVAEKAVEKAAEQFE